MKLIVKDRGMGKTIELIHVSEATGYPIAVSTEMHRRCIIDKAKELKCNMSLTDKVIQKQYVETLKSIGENGNLVVVPEGSSPIVSTGK